MNSFEFRVTSFELKKKPGPINRRETRNQAISVFSGYPHGPPTRDFALNRDDVAAIDAIDTGMRGGPDPKVVDAKTFLIKIED